MNDSTTNQTIFKNLSKLVSIGCFTLASCLISSVAQAVNPDSNWSINSTMTDCSGTSSYGSPSTSCQSYQDDLYENWNSQDGGHGDTDIQTLSVGADSDYLYWEIDLRQNWTDESRQYYLELQAEGNGYFLYYQPKTEDLTSTWKNKGNSGEVEVYTGGAGGYNSDLSGGKNLSSGDFYVRLVNGNIQMALKKSTIGSPSVILTRAYATQNTTLDQGKVHWNQHNTSSDLFGFGGFDNTAGDDPNTWLSSAPPTPPTPPNYLAD